MSEPIVLRLRTPEELIAAVPPLLGFRPTESLVVLALRGSLLRWTAHIDVPDPADAAAVTDVLAEQAARDGASSAMVLLITDHPRPDLRHATLDALRRRGVEVAEMLWAETTQPGARWSCLCDRGDCTLGGTLPDVTGELAAEQAARGQVVQPDRAAALALVASGDPAVLDRRAALLAHQHAGERRRDRYTLVTALALHRAGVPVEDHLVVDMVHLARTPGGFEALMSLAMATGERGRAGAAFLLTLTRETPQSAVAQIAALAGLAQQLAGNGLLARAALELARDADPTSVIPIALLAMLDAGLPPEQVRAWLEGT